METTEIIGKNGKSIARQLHLSARAIYTRVSTSWIEALGAIVEVEDDAERYRLLAQDCLRSSGKGSPPLFVSPTNNESGRVTNAIREARREAGHLGPERKFVQFRNLQWKKLNGAEPRSMRA